MNKRLLSILLTSAMAICPVMTSAEYPTPEDVRGVPADSYFMPYYEEGNPFVTHYAPWLRNLHLMSAEEATANALSGIPGGESNQNVRMLEISPVNSNIMYFITNTSGIYTTKNGGKNWYSVNNNMIGHDARGLWCDVINDNIVYASTRRDGFYRSKNGGKSWELIIEDNDSEQSHRSNTITQDAAGNTYFAASSGIYRLNRSDDSLDCLYDTSNLPVVNEAYADQKGPLWWDIEVSSDGKDIYAAVQRRTNSEATPGLYTSHDGGETWSIKATDTANKYNIYSIVLHPENPKKVYFTATKTAEDTQTPCTLYVSEDGGDTFTAVYVYAVRGSDGVTTYRYFYGLRFGPKNAYGIYPLYFCANETTYPLSVSYDYGKNFHVVFDASSNLGAGTIRLTHDTSYTGWYYQAFAPDMKVPGRIVFAANGIYEKTANGKFNRISGGFSGANVTDITFNSENKPFFVTVDVGSHRADSAYTKNPDGTTNYPTFVEGVKDRFVMAEFNPEDPEHIVACTGLTNSKTNGYYAIRQSFDGGVNFNSMEGTAQLSEEDPSVIANNTVIRFDGDNIYTSYFSSHDGGTTWKRNMFDEETPIFILASSKTKPKKMVGAIGTTTSDTTLCLSEDGGTKWTTIAKLGTPANFDCAEFDVYGENGEDDGDFVWLVKSNRVYYYNIKTGDRNINTYTPGSFNAYSQIAQNPKNPNHILLGSDPENVTTGRDNKLSESYDNGKTWHTVPGLWGKQINEIKFVPNTTEVFIGTMAGVFIYDYAKLNYHFP